MTERKTKHSSTRAIPRKDRGLHQTSDLSGDGVRRTKNSSLLAPDLKQRTVALLRGLDLTLEHHGAPDPIIRELDEQVHSYLDDSKDEMEWLQRCKYLLTFPLAKYLKNDLPPKPDKTIRFIGKINKWMKPRLNGFNRQNTHLWYSWFQAKRCTLPLSEDVVDESYKKHLKALTSPDPGDDKIIDEIFSDKDFISVLDQVRGMFTADFVYNQPSFEAMSAKTSASFEFPRSKGGQQSYLRGIAGLDTFSRNPELEDYYKEFNDINDYSHFPSETLSFLDQVWSIREEASDLFNINQPCVVEMFSMHYYPWVYTKNGIRSNFHLTRYVDYGMIEWSTLKPLKEKRLANLNRNLRCTIQAVLEPNKIRIISKGEALPYYACRPFQKSLLKAIQTFSCFKLTGRPLLSDDIALLTKMALPTDKWFSVDYSAATDGLSWKYSGRILRYIIDLMPKETQNLMLKVLGPHDLYYPKSAESACTEFKGIQTNGQLMGSILSFPILCLANLGVYFLSTKHVQELWSLDERINHVLINGDDMVYASDPSIWERHVDIGKKVGLEMSVGKAYVHREYLNINSTSFHCPLHSSYKSQDLNVCEVGFLNTGLFYGQHKVQGNNEHGKMQLAKAHSKHGDGIVVNINTLLSGSRPGKEIDLLKKLLLVQKDSITTECQTITRQGKKFSRNLFIPLALGGMGVRAPHGFRYKVTKEEVYVAHGYINDIPSCEYTDQYPLPGYPLEQLEVYVDAPWCVKMGGEELAKPVVPVKRISTKKIKHLCRTNFFRYCPNKSSFLGPVPEVERDKVVPIESSLIISEDSFESNCKFVLLPKRVENVYYSPIRKTPIKEVLEEDNGLSSDMLIYHSGESHLYNQLNGFENECSLLQGIDYNECPQSEGGSLADAITSYLMGDWRVYVDFATFLDHF